MTVLMPWPGVRPGRCSIGYDRRTVHGRGSPWPPFHRVRSPGRYRAGVRPGRRSIGYDRTDGTGPEFALALYRPGISTVGISTLVLNAAASISTVVLIPAAA